MVRVIYLLSQGVLRRSQLIEDSVAGRKWVQPGSRASVTDREMVDLAQSLQGWTQSVYRFGCAFLHLSALHDHNDRDPLLQLPEPERRDILDHCRHYHGGPLHPRATFAELVPYLPRVFDKIARNLQGYLSEPEKEHEMTTTYRGLYTVQLEDGTILSVQCVDAAGNGNDVPIDVYRHRGVQPPAESLPNQHQYKPSNP